MLLRSGQGGVYILHVVNSLTLSSKATAHSIEQHVLINLSSGEIMDGPRQQSEAKNNEDMGTHRSNQEHPVRLAAYQHIRPIL